MGPFANPTGFTVGNLLAPFRRDYARFLAGTALRQALVVLGGYSMVLVLRLCTGHAAFPIWWLIVALVVFDAAYVVLDQSLNALFARRIAFPLFGHLRTAALRKVFAMPLEWHQRETAGALIAKVNNGVGRVVQTGEAVSRELCPSLIRTSLSLVPLLIFSPVTAPLLAAALAVFGWLTILENRKRRAFRQSRHENYVRDSGIFSEYVHSVQPVVQFGQTARLLDSYQHLQRQIMDLGIEEMAVAHAYGWRKNMVLSTAKRICQALWIWQLRLGVLDAAMVMYLNMLTEELLTSFWGYAALLERIFEDLEPARILMELLNAQPAIVEAAGLLPVPVPDSVDIRLVNIHFTYTKGKRVVRDFSLAIEGGSILGIVGRSGSGKTTLHHLFSRLFEIQQGQLLVAGTDIREWPLEQLRGVFSSVPHGGGVFFSGTSILDTIRFARPEASPEEAVAAARCACIHDDIERMPASYATVLQEGGSNLSKGQQQRVALAQALLALRDDRKVLVLDEFTSHLDAETESRVLRNLRPWLAGRTVIVIAHRLATVRGIADRIVVLQDGAVVEQGSHQELVERDGWYARMARLQAVT